MKNYRFFVGFNFVGNLQGISSLEFTINSNASSDCRSQLEIDFFDNGEIDFGNNLSADNPVCFDLKTHGCFEELTSPTYYDISDIPFCQKITLSQSPGFKIGAWVRQKPGGQAGGENLTMELHNLNGDSILGGNCELNYEEITLGGDEVYCEIDYQVLKRKEYYVCIYYEDGTGDYELKGHSSSSETCGFNSNPPPTQGTPGAYQIFVEGKAFRTMNANPLKIKISDGKPIDLWSYLTGIYGSGDCSNGCVIPVRFTSKTAIGQEVILEDLEIEYRLDAGSTTKYNFSDLSETSATINADFQKLYLDKGNFSVSKTLKDYNYTLELNKEYVFSEEISVKKIAIINGITPTSTASAYPTIFKVDDANNTGITKYVWDFGDNKTKTTTINEVTHTYNVIGTYNLVITITDSLGKETSQTFIITVKSPKELIESFLSKMQTDLENVKAQINAFDLFYGDELNSVLNIDSSEKDFTNIKKDYATANEEGYNSILTRVLALKIPESVSVSSSTNSLLFYPGEEDVDISVLKDIGGGDYKDDKESEYIDAVFAWNQKNMDTKITFEEISAKYEDLTEPVLRVFQITAEKKNQSQNSYLILKKIENLNFKKDYSERDIEGYHYVYLKDEKTSITFSTTENIDFTNLPMFISPAISKLAIVEETSGEKQKISKATLFVLIIALLAIIGFVLYIILQEWYKKKYEAYLFKNRNDLYNLISYIQTAKKGGADEKKIVSQLKKTGWTSEQVTYVMKKYSGKRTGMVELPVGKILNKFNKKENKNFHSKKPGQKFIPKKRFY